MRWPQGTLAAAALTKGESPLTAQRNVDQRMLEKDLFSGVQVAMLDNHKERHVPWPRQRRQTNTHVQRMQPNLELSGHGLELSGYQAVALNGAHATHRSPDFSDKCLEVSG